MSSFVKNFTGSITPRGNVIGLHWYYGSFKELSAGFMRALSRAINNFLTLKQDL